MSGPTPHLHIAATLLTCLAAVSGGVAAQAGELAWSAARPLEWDDFEGRVDAHAPPHRVAVTAHALSWTYEYATIQTGRECTYQITDLYAEATFEPSRSWVRGGRQSAGVLQHEQGHFDLTQIHKLVFDERTKHLVGETGPCKASRSSNKAGIEAAIVEMIGPFFDEIWERNEFSQEAYDEQTQHGTLSGRQQYWSELIRDGLDGERWHELGL